MLTLRLFVYSLAIHRTIASLNCHPGPTRSFKVRLDATLLSVLPLPGLEHDIQHLVNVDCVQELSFDNMISLSTMASDSVVLSLDTT